MNLNDLIRNGQTTPESLPGGEDAYARLAKLLGVLRDSTVGNGVYGLDSASLAPPPTPKQATEPPAPTPQPIRPGWAPTEANSDFARQVAEQGMSTTPQPPNGSVERYQIPGQGWKDVPRGDSSPGSGGGTFSAPGVDALLAMGPQQLTGIADPAEAMVRAEEARRSIADPAWKLKAEAEARSAPQIQLEILKHRLDEESANRMASGLQEDQDEADKAISRLGQLRAQPAHQALQKRALAGDKVAQAQIDAVEAPLRQAAEAAQRRIRIKEQPSGLMHRQTPSPLYASEPVTF